MSIAVSLLSMLIRWRNFSVGTAPSIRRCVKHDVHGWAGVGLKAVVTVVILVAVLLMVIKVGCCGGGGGGGEGVVGARCGATGVLYWNDATILDLGEWAGSVESAGHPQSIGHQ